MSKPIVYDLYSGLHGWLEAFLLEGYRCVAFDIVDMCAEIGHPRPEGIELRIRDVRSIHGSELKDAAVIVGSSPCQEFSYRAMPWKRAKALPPPYLGMELFNAQFRIQREAIEAAGHYIPLVVENVRGAQKWVGRAAWNYGSFYLWGDVPALMPRVDRVQKFNPDGTDHPQGSWFAIADSKNRGARKVNMNFHEYEKTGRPRRSFQSCAVEETGHKVPSASGRRTDVGKGARFTTRDCGVERLHLPDDMRLPDPGHGASVGEQPLPHPQLESLPLSGLSSSRSALYADRDSLGVKQHGSVHIWYRTGNGAMSSKSSARKAASAMIAKIPFPLAQHIARTFKPVDA